MIDFPLILTTLSKGLETIKSLQEIDKNFDAATYKAKIADLTSAVADAKMALVDAREEIGARDKAIIDLKEGLKFRREHTVDIRGFRYEKGPDGNPIGMPFCNRCDAVDGLLIRIVQTRDKNGYKAVCPQCKSDFGLQHGYTYPEDRIKF